MLLVFFWFLMCVIVYLISVHFTLVGFECYCSKWNRRFVESFEETHYIYTHFLFVLQKASIFLVLKTKRCDYAFIPVGVVRSNKNFVNFCFLFVKELLMAKMTVNLTVTSIITTMCYSFGRCPLVVNAIVKKLNCKCLLIRYFVIGYGLILEKYIFIF